MSISPEAERGRAGLARKATAAIALPLVLAVAAAAGTTALTTRGALQDAAGEAKVALTDLLAAQVAEPLAEGRGAPIDAALSALAARSGLVAGVVLRDGVVVARLGDEEAAALGLRRAAAGAAEPFRLDGRLVVSAPAGATGRLAVAWDLDAAGVPAAQGALVPALVPALIGLGALGAGLLAARLLLGRALLRPLRETADDLTRLSQGELGVEPAHRGRRDEIGALARAAERLRVRALEAEEAARDAAQARLAAETERRSDEAERADAAAERARATEALAAALERLAAGDLAHRVDGSLPEAWAPLRDGLNRAFEALEGAVGRVAAAARGLSGAASEATGGIDDLSRRTESQAASLEESAAALEQIVATTKSSAEGAASARRVVAKARDEAEAGGRVVGEAVEAMGAIARSSEQISDIIGLIDEIAFQTNLLALNAGVEAARAGEAGRGFAVVASEVRALAQRSADSAREIRGLIGASREQVERGVELVGGAGEALGRIIRGVAEIDAAVTEIAASTEEQATGLAEVNGAVGRMDQLTQQNASAFERLTRSAREMAAQAENCAALTGSFRLRERPASAPPVPVPRAPARPAPGAAPVETTVTPLRRPPARPAPALAPATERGRTAEAAPVRIAPPSAARPPLAAGPGKRAAARTATESDGWEEF